MKGVAADSLHTKEQESNGFHCLPSSTKPVMEMLEDYIISMKSNAKYVCHTL
jgi:hypothetical protein